MSVDIKLYLEAWAAGGCVLCGGHNRDDAPMAHRTCWLKNVLSKISSVEINTYINIKVEQYCESMRTQKLRQLAEDLMNGW